MADNSDETLIEDPVTLENKDTEGIMQEAQRLKHKGSHVSMDCPSPPDHGGSNSDPFEWDFDEEQPGSSLRSSEAQNDPDTTTMATEEDSDDGYCRQYSSNNEDDDDDDDDKSSNSSSDNVIVSSDEDGQYSECSVEE